MTNLEALVFESVKDLQYKGGVVSVWWKPLGRPIDIWARNDTYLFVAKNYNYEQPIIEIDRTRFDNLQIVNIIVMAIEYLTQREIDNG